MENKNIDAAVIQNAKEKYKSARVDLLLMIVLTVVNIVLYAVGSDTMMLFSATIPYITGIYAIEFVGLSAFYYTITAVVVAMYICCWILSKKRYGWMIFATILFVIDTLALLLISFYIGEVFGTIDMIIHALVLYYLIVGVINGRKLKRISPTGNIQDILEEEQQAEEVSMQAVNVEATNNEVVEVVEPAEIDDDTATE